MASARLLGRSFCSHRRCLDRRRCCASGLAAFVALLASITITASVARAADPKYPDGPPSQVTPQDRRELSELIGVDRMDKAAAGLGMAKHDDYDKFGRVLRGGQGFDQINTYEKDGDKFFVIGEAKGGRAELDERDYCGRGKIVQQLSIEWIRCVMERMREAIRGRSDPQAQKVQDFLDDLEEAFRRRRVRTLFSKTPVAHIRPGAGATAGDPEFVEGPPRRGRPVQPQTAKRRPPSRVPGCSDCDVGSEWANRAWKQALQNDPRHAPLAGAQGIHPGYMLPDHKVYTEKFQRARIEDLEKSVSTRVSGLDAERASKLDGLVSGHYGKEKRQSVADRRQFWRDRVATDLDGRDGIIRSRALFDELESPSKLAMRGKLFDVASGAFSSAAWAYYEGDMEAALKAAASSVAWDLLKHALEAWMARGSTIAAHLLGLSSGVLPEIALWIARETVQVAVEAYTDHLNGREEAAQQLYVTGPENFFDYFLVEKSIRVTRDTLHQHFGKRMGQKLSGDLPEAEDLREAIEEFRTRGGGGSQQRYHNPQLWSDSVWAAVHRQAQEDLRNGIARELIAHEPDDPDPGALLVQLEGADQETPQPSRPSVLIANATVSPPTPRSGDRVTVRADVVILGLPKQKFSLVLRHGVDGPQGFIRFPSTKEEFEFHEKLVEPNEVTQVKTIEHSFTVDDCFKPGSYRYEVTVADGEGTLDTHWGDFTVAKSDLEEAIEKAQHAQARALAAANEARTAAQRARDAQAKAAAALARGEAASAAALKAKNAAESVSDACREAQKRLQANQNLPARVQGATNRLTEAMEAARGAANAACELAKETARAPDAQTATSHATQANTKLAETRGAAARAQSEATAVRKLAEDAKSEDRSLEDLKRRIGDATTPLTEANAGAEAVSGADGEAKTALSEAEAASSQASAASKQADAAAGEVAGLLESYVARAGQKSGEPEVRETSPCLLALLTRARETLTSAQAAAATAHADAEKAAAAVADIQKLTPRIEKEIAETARLIASAQTALRPCSGIGPKPEVVADLSAAADAAEVLVPRVDSYVQAAYGCSLLAADAANRKRQVAAIRGQARNLLGQLQAIVGRAEGIAQQLEGARQFVYRLAAEAHSAATAAQARQQAAAASGNLCAEGDQLMAALRQYAAEMNSAGQRIDYDRRGTQMYTGTVCELKDQAHAWWNAGDVRRAHNLAYNARQFFPYVERFAADARQYAEHARRVTAQAQAAHARLAQIVATLSQLATGAGAGAGQAEEQNALQALSAARDRQAEFIALTDQGRAKRSELDALAQSAPNEIADVLAESDQWLTRLAPAGSATQNAVAQISANVAVVQGNWGVVRATDARVAQALQACGGLRVEPIDDLLAAARTIDAEYQATVYAYNTAQQCGAYSASIEAAAAQAATPQQPVTPPPARPGAPPPTSTPGPDGRCPPGSINLLGVCSGR